MTTVSKNKSIHYIFTKINDNEFLVFNPVFKDFKTKTFAELALLEKKFELLKGYDADEMGLYTYYKDFVVWNQQMYNNDCDAKIWCFNSYFNNTHAVFETFNKYCDKTKLDLSRVIGSIECYWFEGCNNGGLTYCKNGTYECFGYDYNSFYPRLLGDSIFNLQIPLKEGEQVKVDNLNLIQFGFYNVFIECSNPDFLKIFKFSKSHIYTHYSLEFAIKHQKNFDVKIRLNDAVEYNAYIYDDKDIIYAKELFGSWFDKLIALKNKHPENKLVKHLLSSLWGTLSTINKHHAKCDEELEKYDYIDGHHKIVNENRDSKNSYYTLVDKNNMYKYNIRLKPFLLAYSRNIMGDIAFNNHFDEIVRIYCDNITYKSDVSFDVVNMIKENKTSGIIAWKIGRQIKD